MRRAFVLAAMMAIAVLGQSLTQPGGNPSSKRGFVPKLKFVVHYKTMEPATLTIPEGDYDIQISSGVVQTAIEYQLEEQGKSEKRTQAKESGKSNQLMPVEFKAGTYTLSVKGFGDRWKSVIVVTKK